MRGLDNIKTLLTPSFASGTTVIATTVVALGGVTFATSSGTGALYDWLFGETSSASQIQTAKTTLQTLNDTILGNTALNQLMFLLLWALIGLAVYVIIVGINRQVADISEDLDELGGNNTHAGEIRKEIIGKFILRCIFAGLWGIFILVSLKIYLPFSFLCAHIGGASLNTLNGWLFILAGAATMILTLHLHIVFVRLILLRTRIFVG